MTNIVSILHLLTPELTVLLASCAILIYGLYTGKTKAVYYLVQLTLLCAGVSSLVIFPSEAHIAFSGMFVLDPLASVLKLFIYLNTVFIFMYARSYIKARGLPELEYYILSLFSVLGMMVLASAHNLLTVFLGLEIFSLPIYALVAIVRDSAESSEAAMKYFVMGAVAAGMLLYGMSMLYGATHSLDISVIAAAIKQFNLVHQPMLSLSLVFIVVGLAFKLGAVPFHMWVPDVYQGATSSVTLFIASASKIAALAMCLRLLAYALIDLHVQWQQLLIIVSVLSMALGNLVAIVQTNIKRMLAYSAIAHMGYICLGLIAGNSDGFASSLFYILSYSLMSLGAFGLIVVMSQNGIIIERIDDLRGLNNRNPWLAFIMLLLMFSMAGIPPTVGFFAKMGVLQAIINQHHVWLASFAMIFAVIGAYYYLNVVKVMYFEEANADADVIRIDKATTLAVSLNGLAILALGVFPGSLFSLCHTVI